MSTSPDLQSNWSYRITASRQITVKARNDSLRKISVIDVSTNLPFPLEATVNSSTKSLEVEKMYFATFRVYTLKNVENVSSDFVEFFKAVDTDQSFEDFIKAYWLYPSYIRFDLVEAEPI